MKLRWRTMVLSVLAVLLLLTVIVLFQAPDRPSAPERTYSQLLQMGPKLKSATLIGDELVGRDEDGVFTVRLPRDSTIADRLAQHGTDIAIREKPEAPWPVTFLVSWLPSLVYLIVFSLPLFRIARALDILVERQATSHDERA